jgi:predicted lipoprotein with Yx(FWY)xxD motif
VREYLGRTMPTHAARATLPHMHTSPQHQSRRRYVVGFVGFGMLVLAACGSSGSSYSSPRARAPSPSKPRSSSAAVVSVARGTKLGSVLADANGRTLYTLTDNGAPVPCASQCTAIWPPLLLPAGTGVANAATGVRGIGTVIGGGGIQVTQMGRPLYRFSGDTKRGDTNGDGINSFGGEWRAVPASGAAPNTAPPSASGGSSGGYGY